MVSGGPDDRRERRDPLAGRFCLKHEPPQDLSGGVILRVHVGNRSGTKILRRPLAWKNQVPAVSKTLQRIPSFPPVCERLGSGIASERSVDVR